MHLRSSTDRRNIGLSSAVSPRALMSECNITGFMSSVYEGSLAFIRERSHSYVRKIQFSPVLAKNDIAKRYGIRTGQVLWEARQQCPGLVCVPAHYERYLAFSAQARDIYTSYTDQVESFGLDEDPCWPGPVPQSW